MTSARDLAVVREGVSLGVVQYVLKPFTFATLRDRLNRYAEFRSAAAEGEATGQDEVDRAHATQRAPGPAALPKGLSGPTLERVIRTLRAAPEGLTATAAAEAAGLSASPPPLPGTPGRHGARGPQPPVRPCRAAGVGLPVAHRGGVSALGDAPSPYVL